jgi:hypothetical protein
MARNLTACTLVLLTATIVRGEPEKLPPKPLTLYPVAPAGRALRYALLPELRDQTPGNAAARYERAVKLMPRPLTDDESTQTDRWLEMPVKDLPREDLRKFLKRYQNTLREVEAAARCEQCDWGITERLRKNGVRSNPLPEGMKSLRDFAFALDLRARLELADGQVEQALGTVRIGLAMARQAADAPSLVGALIGLAVASRMTYRLEEVLQHPKAPNLYWPLTDLPRPFVDVRNGLQGERVAAYGTFPGLAEVAGNSNAGPVSAEKIKEWADVVLDKKNYLGNFDGARELARALIRKHDGAKQALIAQGRPRAKVEAMPHLQVALLHALRLHDQLLDEEMKWQSLPYWQARPGLVRRDQRVRELQTKHDKDAPDSLVIQPAQLLGPTSVILLTARTRLDRRFAALRCIEAIRLYAAAHGGKLPVTLADIKEVPLPIDPVSGKGFGYKLVGAKALLTAPPFPGEKPTQYNTISYELSIKH